ncbi:sensor histidine kinase [Labedella endophytica]|uniref:sensor histidine kinase n=1 Tax=Labedella endophytica TaxID=1523160 RepID=UPI00140D3FA3|nr:HAMP domain-containing sensor histidine kinase [Labedella endophytica]
MSSLLLAALVVLGIASVAILRQSLAAQTESTLFLSADSTISEVVSSIEATGSPPAFDDASIIIPPDAFYITLTGDEPTQSALFGRDYSFEPLTAAQIRQIRDQLANPERRAEEGILTETVSLDGEGSYLVTMSPYTRDDGTDYTVINGVGLTGPDSVVGAYMLGVGIGAFLIAALAAGIGFRILTRELDPLERVAHVAGSVASTPLSSGAVGVVARVPRDARLEGSETDRVAEALNRLLAHVEVSLTARHRAEESMRRFIAEASHELRNPLASIRGYADFYAQPNADPVETAGALVRIGAEAKRMSRLVDDLLLLAKLDADPEVVREEVELSRVVLETVSDARFAYPDHVWRMAMPDEAVVVSGDEGWIRQMLLNLVANAGHHTPEGTSVLISIVEADAAVEVLVEDDGPGIPADALPTLFDRFTQAGTTDTRERTTVGLGLAIVDALADASGSSVSVDSDENGTRFTIRIPTVSTRDAPPSTRDRTA